MRTRPQDILMPVAAGLCCKPGGFHIDPVRPVERAGIVLDLSPALRSSVPDFRDLRRTREQ